MSTIVQSQKSKRFRSRGASASCETPYRGNHPRYPPPRRHRQGSPQKGRLYFGQGASVCSPLRLIYARGAGRGRWGEHNTPLRRFGGGRCEGQCRRMGPSGLRGAPRIYLEMLTIYIQAGEHLMKGVAGLAASPGGAPGSPLLGFNRSADYAAKI